MNAENKPLRVLVADDHAPTRDDVRRALDADERFNICSEVADAAEAVQAAMRKQPDICLLDIRMPGSGLAAAWEIAARLPRVKIVMLTVSDEDTDLFTALRAGADGYLLKNMNMRRLPDALLGVFAGEAAMPRELVARVLERFHGREPRWRPLVTADISERPADEPGMGGARAAGPQVHDRGDRGQPGALGQRGARAHHLCRAQTPSRGPGGRGRTVPRAERQRLGT